MSLTEANLLAIVKKQYLFKLKAYLGLFLTLIAVQALGILLSINGVMSSGTGNGELSFVAKIFAGDYIIGLTMIWAFFVAHNLNTNEYRKIDFMFVTNRLSSNLSSVGFVLTAAAIGGITAALAGGLLRVIIYFTHGSQNIASQYFFILPQELLLSIIATTFYIILICAASYFLGTLTQKHQGFAVLLPVLIIGLLVLTARDMGNINVMLVKIANFFTNESSLLLFMLKTSGVASILFYSSILMSNRLEA